MQDALSRASNKMAIMASRMANRRMRSEVLPQLSGSIPRQLSRSWNPLTLVDLAPITLKLRIADPLVKQILASQMLMDTVEQIIEDSVANAVVDNLAVEHTSYVAAALQSLFDD